MKGVELYGRVRYAVQIEGLSHRETARRFGLDPRTVAKMVRFSVPPGYVRKKPPAKPKLDPFIAVIDRILGDDKSRPKKQQHTAKRVFERLRDEYGFTGGITIVKDYVAGWRQRTQEMFVPLVHPPGHAQADFGEAIGIIGGVERKIHFFAFDLPHSDACFVVGYPAETTEAFCDGHVRAFAFFGGVPQSILYDNTKIAVARILGDGKRQRTRVRTLRRVMAWPLLEPSRPHTPHPPVLGSSSDTKSLGPLLVGIIAHVQIRIVITTATETPRGQHSHAVRAHVSEGHRHLGSVGSQLVASSCSSGAFLRFLRQASGRPDRCGR
jgi:transposase